MHRVSLQRPDDFEKFRESARGLLMAEVRPENTIWEVNGESDLFGEPPPPRANSAISVPAGYMPLAEDIVCHRDPERFALLYSLLWRLTHGEKSLLMIASDPLIHRLRQMQKSVRRDTHKMTAFVRFRQMQDERGERYVAWFEPEHHILRHVSSFFVDRFSAMFWSILTPEGSMHWNMRALTFGPAIGKSHAPQGDDFESWWRSYYRSTFNPSRANPTLQRAEMPKKYWRNLPEAPLIPDMLADARARSERMIKAEPTAPRAATGWKPALTLVPDVGTLDALRADVGACQRCPLHAPATQAVFGEGPSDAAVVFVGEQPGDQEDLAGKPFIGPAGQMLDRALAEAGIDRSRVYVTNAVKHFKFEPRGKRRIHSKPNSGEIEHCRWWLDRELSLIQPKLVVAMGATAVRGLTGRTVTISRERGRVMPLGARDGFITVHPSFLLRLPDPEAQAREYAGFVADLRTVAAHLPAILKAA